MKKQTLSLVAIAKAKNGKSQYVMDEIMKVVEPSKHEHGCLNFDLHQANTEPDLFIVYERWETREDWQNHMESEHVKNYKKRTEDSVDSFTIHELTKLCH